MQDRDIDRFRGWALMALYASMSVLSLLLILVAFRFWPSVDDGSNHVFLLAASASATVIFCFRASLQFYHQLRAGGRPRMVLLPFAFMAVTLYATSLLMADF